MVLTNFVFKCHNHDGINDDVTITGGHLGRDKTITKLPKDSTGSLYGEMSPITLRHVRSVKPQMMPNS